MHVSAARFAEDIWSFVVETHGTYFRSQMNELLAGQYYGLVWLPRPNHTVELRIVTGLRAHGATRQLELLAHLCPVPPLAIGLLSGDDGVRMSAYCAGKLSFVDVDPITLAITNNREAEAELLDMAVNARMPEAVDAVSWYIIGFETCLQHATGCGVDHGDDRRVFSEKEMIDGG